MALATLGRTVRVMRTPETVFHADTIASLTGVPVTLNHPREKKVSPDNWRQNVVGNLIGTPRRNGDLLEGEVLVGDQRGIDALDKGVDEMSIGYTHSILQAEAGLGFDYITEGPLTVNHVAIVPSGRAGPEIRIRDEGADMTDEERKAMSDEITKNVVTGLKGQDATPEAVAKAVTDAVTPLAAKVDAMVKEQTDAVAAAAEAARKVADAAAADVLINDAVAVERKRVAVRDAAMPLIDESKRAGLKDASIREMLEAAVGDSISNVKDASEEYLRGIVDMMVSQRAKVSFPGASKNVPANDMSGAREKYIATMNDYKPKA